MTEDESQTATEPTNDLSHTEVFIVDLHILYCLPTAQMAKSGDFEAAASPTASANCYYVNTCYFERSN